MWANNLSDNKLSLILFAAASIWGLYWVPLRFLEAGGVTEAWSVAVFSALPMLVLLPLALTKKNRAGWQRAAVLGGLVGCGMGFYAFGLVTTSVVRTTILFYLTPIWSTIIGVIWLSETLTKGRVIAIALGLIGLVLLVSGQGEDTPPLNFGDFCAFLSGVFWAMGAAAIKRYPDTPTTTITMFQFAASMAVGVFFALLFVPQDMPGMAEIIATLPVAAGAGVLILLPSVFVILWISKRLFPGRVGILMMSEAMVAIVSATIFLPHETMTILQWAGGATIIAACFCEVVA